MCVCVTQVSGEKEFFAKMVVDAVGALDPQTLDLRMIGIKKVTMQAHVPMHVCALPYMLMCPP